jgi:hypothetical protein
MRMASRLAALVVLGGTFFLPEQTALACTCASLGARELVQQTDAAFIGTFVKSEPFGGEHEFYDRVYTFRVEESFKRDLGSEVRVLSGGSCGVYALKGRLQGYALEEYQQGLYTSGSCLTAEPGELRRADRPLPPPTGRGSPAFILGGAFGEIRTIALDAAGRTLAYGRGEGEVGELIRCPGDRRLVELVLAERGGLFLAVRELPSLRVVDRLSLPEGIDGRPLAVACPDDDAGRLLLFSSDVPYGGEQGGSIWKREGSAWRRIPVGKSVDKGTFVETTAYLTSSGAKPRLIRYDLRTDTRRVIGRVPSGTQGWVQSPDGRRIAGLASFPPPEFPKLVMVELDADPPSVLWRHVGREMDFARIDWLGDDRLMLLGSAGSVRTYDASLRLVGEWKDGWAAFFAGRAGDRVYGMVHPPTRLASVRLSDGRDQRTIARLEPGISSMLVMPDGVAAPVAAEPSPGKTSAARIPWTLLLAVLGLLAGVFLAKLRISRRQ